MALADAVRARRFAGVYRQPQPLAARVAQDLDERLDGIVDFVAGQVQPNHAAAGTRQGHVGHLARLFGVRIALQVTMSRVITLKSTWACSTALMTQSVTSDRANPWLWARVVGLKRSSRYSTLSAAASATAS